MVSGLGRLAPGLIPSLNRTVTKLAGSSSRVDQSDRIFTTRRLVRFTEMEYALPRAAAAPVVRGVLARVEKEGHAVNFPLEVRFVAQDDAFLSPASGRDSCYVAIHMYKGMPFEPFFRAAEEVFRAHGGRPHLGEAALSGVGHAAAELPGLGAVPDAAGEGGSGRAVLYSRHGAGAGEGVRLGTPFD